MKCPYCGKELMSEATRCDGCGASVSNTNQPSQNTSNQTPEFNYQQPKSSNKSGGLIVILFIAAIIAVSYFLFFAGGSSNSENTSNNEAKNEEVEDNTIVKTRKQSYLNMAGAYSNSIKSLINMGYIRLYSTDTIVFVPVGDTSMCGELESGGSPIFGSKWNYAYVGVTYNGSKYNSYFISEDDSLYGIPLLSYDEIANGDINKIYNGHNGEITDEVSAKLKELYSISENKKMSVEEVEDIKSVIIPDGEAIKTVVFISASAGCKY